MYLPPLYPLSPNLSASLSLLAPFPVLSFTSIWHFQIVLSYAFPLEPSLFFLLRLFAFIVYYDTIHKQTHTNTHTYTCMYIGLLGFLALSLKTFLRPFVRLLLRP